ncbi:MAG: GNAT family N-acetyltransferase [Parachlamydiaceae bacterium]
MTEVISSTQCRLLEWDTAFFGRRIGKIERCDLNAHNMQLAVDWAATHHIDCLYYCCAIDNDQAIRTAELYQFNLVDVKVEMTLELSKQEVSNNKDIFVRPYRTGELAQLEAINDDIFENGRFYHDPEFSRDQASALYREWLRKSCECHAEVEFRGFASDTGISLLNSGETVFVAEYEHRIAGFITFHKENASTARIGIVGACSKTRRKGIGGALVAAMIKHYKDDVIRKIKVVTQGRNIAAQNLFQNQGFYVDSMSLWYHKWFNVFNNRF